MWVVAAKAAATTTTRGGFVQVSDRTSNRDGRTVHTRKTALGTTQSEISEESPVGGPSYNGNVRGTETSATTSITEKSSVLIRRMVIAIRPLLGRGQYIVVSILSDVPSSCGCLVVSREESAVNAGFYPLSSAARCIESLPMGHTLSLLSDIIVIHSSACDNGELLLNNRDDDGGLLAGWAQRRQILGCGGMVLVDNVKDPEQLVLHRSGWTPSILERFDVHENEEWEITDYVQDLLLRSTDSTSSCRTTQSVSPDCKIFPVLFERTYRSLGGLGTLGWKHLIDADVMAPSAGAAVSTSDDAKKDHTSFALPQPSEEPPKVVAAGAPPSTESTTGSAVTKTNAEESVWVLLDDLRAKQEDNVLSAGSMPLDFGAHAEAILESLAAAMDNSEEDAEPEVVLLQLKDRYADHLEQLRDYFGKMYETMLDRSATGNPRDTAPLQETIVRTFRSAAQEAIPVSARPGGRFCDKIDLTYVSALAGLSSDLEMLSENREDIALEQFGDDENLPEKERKRIPRWCKKLASRAIMLGVNYIQGRLALHALRQAALERERDMPKIPLF